MTKTDLFALQTVTGLLNFAEICDPRQFSKAQTDGSTYLDHDFKSILGFQTIQQLLDWFFILFAFQPRRESIAPGHNDCCYTWYK